ncbi:MAG: rhomboid family intramembrane serine protease [Clostridiales bacterium]
MKEDFINSFMMKFIQKRGYLSQYNDNKEIYNENGTKILFKEFASGITIIKLIDGDHLSKNDLIKIYNNNKYILENFNNFQNIFIYSIFFFKNTPEHEKLNLIEYNDLKSLPKKYSLSLSVNLENKTINKHFEVPLGEPQIIKTINEQFQNGVLNCKIEDIKAEIEKKEKESVLELKTEKFILTKSLIIINVLVAIALFFYSKFSSISYNELLTIFGAKDNALIMYNHEFWRFFTPVFLHANITHLALNCISLYIIGNLIERLYGRGRFLFIYISAGFVGSIASFCFSLNNGVGASGAIFGLLGAMLYFYIQKTSLAFKMFGFNIFIILFFNLAYGFSVNNIDNFAHIGGLIGGFLATWSVNTSIDKKLYFNKVIGLILLLFIVIFGIIYGFSSEKNQIMKLVGEMDSLTLNYKRDEAILIGKEILDKNYEHDIINTQVYWSISKNEISNKNYNSALDYAKKLIPLDPINGHYLSGFCYYNLYEYNNAKEEFLKVEEYNPGDDRIKVFLNELN